jgi:hypothetical protein
VGKLKRRWGDEYAAWGKADLSKERWVYLWVDGVYSGIRAEDQKLCALIVIGVNERGKKHFLAIEDGVRESKQSWREVLIGLKARGLVAPKVAIGDGALGFWAAIDEVFPSARTQRCWVHKMANVLNYLPRSVQAKAKAGLQASQGRVLKDFALVDAVQARNMCGELVPAHQAIRLARAGDQRRAVRRRHQTGQQQSAAKGRRLIISAIHNI